MLQHLCFFNNILFSKFYRSFLNAMGAPKIVGKKKCVSAASKSNDAAETLKYLSFFRIIGIFLNYFNFYRSFTLILLKVKAI